MFHDRRDAASSPCGDFACCVLPSRCCRELSWHRLFFGQKPVMLGTGRYHDQAFFLPTGT